jgi:hypothetical protein
MKTAHHGLPMKKENPQLARRGKTSAVSGDKAKNGFNHDAAKTFFTHQQS